jgi:lipopolysaccharide biosynthesis glycosyltransferase
MATALESVYYNRNKNYNYNVYLFTLWKATDLDKKKLNNGYDASFHIKFIEIDEKVFSQYKNLKKKIYVYCIRLIIWNYLYNVDKILYMDCDIVVNWDISELFFMDLWNNVVWAAKDCINWSNYAGKKTLKRYFNTGVLLINLNLWKKKNIIWKNKT